MSHHEIILVQAPSSPYARLLQEALRLNQAVSVGRAASAAQLAQLGQEAPSLVIWDVSGLGALENESLAQLLAVAQVGVMLVCPAVDEAVLGILGRVSPLALLAAPTGIHQVAAALEVALSTHRRIHGLTRELEDLNEQLRDRMVVERAKRVLMEARGLSEAQAMSELQSYARRANQKLAQVARRILAAYRVFNGLHEGEGEPGQGEDPA